MPESCGANPMAWRGVARICMLNAVLRAGQRVGLAWRKSSAMRQHGPFGTRVLYALGLLRIELGDLPGAIRVLSRAVARAPTANVVRFSLATAHYQARQFVEASRQLLVLVNETGNPRARALLAMVLGELGLVDEAENHASEAAAAAPWDALAIQAQVKVFARRMRFADAVGLIEKFLTAGGHDSVLASRLPYYLTLQPDAEPEHMARACALVSTKLFLPAAYEPVRRQSRRRSSARPRIGYVSGDLRKHVIVRFLEHVLRHHDRSEFEVFLYDNTASPDAVNERLRAIGHRWRTIVGQDDDEAARRIAADEIDLLVDLSGHTDGHRLGVFARRPAQVQATWLGFPGSTGLATMDWRIVDRWTVPDGSAFPGTERPLRLPTVFACFQPQDSEPLRAAATGGPVFGSVHKLEKLNADVVTVWSRILVGDPSARLLIARDQFDPLVARWILREFRERGIDAADESGLCGMGMNDVGPELAQQPRQFPQCADVAQRVQLAAERLDHYWRDAVLRGVIRHIAFFIAD